MKKLIILAIVIVFTGLTALAVNVYQNPNCNVLNRQGCCSHHGGVCGCGGSRLMCCDGTLSPSCPCY